MTLTTERPMSDEQRLKLWEFARDVERARSGTPNGSQFAAEDCAPSTDGAAFSTADDNADTDQDSWWQACAGLICLTVFIAGMAVAMALVVERPKPEPDCRMQFTPDVRYVEHCDYRDGRGYVEVE